MKFKTYNIDKNYSNTYYFLKDIGFSESFITLLRKKEGSILINENISTTRSPLFSGDILKIDLDSKKKSNFKTNDLPLNIIYEDDYLLIVNKPSGITTSPSKSHYNENLSGAILGYMQQKDENFVLRMINRLDKDTSGIIVVAKDIETYKNMGKIEKTYYAICKGVINDFITIDKPIKTINNDGINEIKRIISDVGKPAKTFVEPIEKLKNATLLKIVLEHGRTHQIRVHLSSINHPLIGDEIYGEKSSLISHSALVCKNISFKHPTTEQKISLEIDFPEDFKNLIKLLK